MSFEMNEQNALSTFKRLVGEVEEKKKKKEKVTSPSKLPAWNLKKGFLVCCCTRSFT